MSIILVESVVENCNEFLLKVFKEIHPELNYINGVTEEEREELICQQFKVEQSQLIQMYPKAKLNIIMLNEKPIGIIYISHGETSDRILQIGILEDYRGLGIGKKVMNKIIKESVKRGKTVSLQVAWFNQRAYVFYEKLGFKVVENNTVFYEMQYIS